MAVTIDQFINGSVPFDAVLNQIKKHFALQFKARNLYVDDERTRGSILSLFVDEKNYKPRIDVQDELLDEVFAGDISRHKAGAGSLGSVQVGDPSPGRNIQIRLRPHGRASGGINNETIMINGINQFLDGAGEQGMTVEFRTKKGKTFIANNVTKADGVGTVGYGGKGYLVPKSDVDLITSDGKRIPVSIKQANADFWGGMETWFYPDGKWGAGADTYMRLADENPDIDITIKQVGTTGIYHLHNTIGKTGMAFECDDNLKEILAFGNDIRGNPKGLIVKKTFSSKSFELEDKDGEQIIVVHTDENIIDVKQLQGDVFVLFMNTGGVDDSSGKIKTFRGKNSKIAPGVRVIGCTARRALSKRGHVKLVKLKGNKLEKS